jgi:WD40 repeat protein
MTPHSLHESTEPTVVRIFFSSPSDVAIERDCARHVVALLGRWYGDRVTLVPVMWEELALTAEMPFQDQIDLVAKSVDIAVFIVWSKIGTPVVVDGRHYKSGTEREFDLVLRTLEDTGGTRPDVLFYFRRDNASFDRLLQDENDDGKLRLLEEKKLVNVFLQENFWSEQGNRRAYHHFQHPVDFAVRLKVHLMGLIDQRIDRAALITNEVWTEVPYRGLEAFDLEHAAIFFGREVEVVELEQRLRDRHRFVLEGLMGRSKLSSSAFVAVIGASGSGKSSLVRAGLQASLTRFNLDQGVGVWRTVVLIPGQTDGNLLLGLVRVIAETPGALPELRAFGIPPSDLAESLARAPLEAVSLCFNPVFLRLSDSVGGRVQLLIVIDQFEELFTDDRIGEADREGFLCALEALAQSGWCWVVSTLRSDFYSLAQRSKTFLRMKGDTGHFDLLPPGPEAIRRIITEPARLAGQRFEKIENGESLDGKILEDAQRQADNLPLLSDLLLELYLQRSQPENKLTFAAYQELGGLEGALTKRADKVFSDLPPDQQSAWPELLHALVTVEVDADTFGVRRRANKTKLANTPAKAGLIDAFVKARLLTASGDSAEDTVSFAHEALLREWSRIAEWIRENRQYLQIRSRVEQSMKRWANAGQRQRSDLLLADGLNLEEGLSLIDDAPLLVQGTEYESLREYIEASRRHHDERRKREDALRQSLTDNAQRNEGVGLLFRAAIADEQGKRYPETLFHAARAIGFEGVGRGESSGEVAQDDIFPVLLTTNRNPKHREAADDWIRQRPSYLPVWHCSDSHVPVAGLRWSPNGRILGVAFGDGALRTWDLTESLDCARRAQGDGKVSSLTLSPDGRMWVVGGADGTVRGWDGQGELSRELLTKHGAGLAVNSLTFSPDGRWLASAAQDGLRVTEIGKGASHPALPGSTGPIRAVAFSPENAAVAAITDEGRITIWEWPTGFVRHCLQRNHLVDFESLAFSPDGGLLAAWAPDGSIHLWDAERGERKGVRSMPGAQAERTAPHNQAVAFRQDGTSLATGTPEGQIRLWDLSDPADPQLLATLGEENPKGRPPALAFGPDGLLLAEGRCDGTVRIWNVSGQVGESNLYGYFEHDWYVFDDNQEVSWKGGRGACSGTFLNQPPGSLIGIWNVHRGLNEIDLLRRLFRVLLKAKNWASAMLIVNQLRDVGSGTKEADELITAVKENLVSCRAKSAFPWNRDRFWKEQLRSCSADR